jgi:hypothetical protein
VRTIAAEATIGHHFLQRLLDSKQRRRVLM